MDDIEKLKHKLKSKKKSNDNNGFFKNIALNKILSKVLISVIVFLILSITIKVSPNCKEFLYKNVFEDNFSFASVNKIYNKYFGEVLPVASLFKEEAKPVFKENLTYTNKEKYLDGVKLTVSDNYLVPIIESGMVVFIGEKEGYGNTVIVQQVNGVDTWYGNINTSNVKLYEYVEKGNLLGESSNSLYLVFKKDGVVLDYNEYLK